MSNQSDSASLPRDNNSAPIQVLSCEPDVLQLSATSTSASGAVPSGCLIVEIACLTTVHIRFGVGSATAATSDRLIPSGAIVCYTIPLIGNTRATHVAVIKAAGASDGLVTIAAMK